MDLVFTYCLVGAYDAARDLMRRADAAPTGPAQILEFSSQHQNVVFKDFTATPNFASRLREAGIDVSGYRGDCPPPAGTD